MKKKQINSRRLKETGFYISVIAIPLINFLFLEFYQNYISVFLYAAKDYDYDAGKFFYASDILINFKRFFSELAEEVAWKQAFFVSFKGYALSWLVNTPLTLFIPYYIVKKHPGSKAFKFILMLPSMVATMVWTMIYTNFVENALVDMFHLSMGPLSNKDTQWGAIWTQHLITGMGSSMLLFTGIYGGVSDSTIDAGKIDGCGVFRELWHIYFPVLYPIWAVNAAVGLNSLFSGVGPIEYFGYSANENVRTIGYLLFSKVMNSSEPIDRVISCAGSIVFTLGILPLVSLFKWLLTRFGPSEDAREPIKWFWQKERKGAKK